MVRKHHESRVVKSDQCHHDEIVSLAGPCFGGAEFIPLKLQSRFVTVVSVGQEYGLVLEGPADLIRKAGASDPPESGALAQPVSDIQHRGART